MGHPDGSGPFPRGLAADLLGRPPMTMPPGLAGGLLQGMPGATLAPPMAPGAGQAPIAATQAPAAPLNPRLTQDNVERLGRVMESECGEQDKGCTPETIQAVGSTVINRMDRAGTDAVKDVTGGEAYASGKTPTPGMMFTAARLLSGQLPDNTGGATNFYSPKSMPKEGGDIDGWDTGGGLEQIAGGGPEPHPRNWSPGFANGPKAYPRNIVPGVDDWYFKFYTQPGTGRVH